MGDARVVVAHVWHEADVQRVVAGDVGVHPAPAAPLRVDVEAGASKVEGPRRENGVHDEAENRSEGQGDEDRHEASKKTATFGSGTSNVRSHGYGEHSMGTRR